MTLTVGRCVLPDPSNVDASGDFLSLSGVFYSTATTAANRAAEAQARSAQLMGMVDNPDEDVFRLVWSSESMYDGFYAVEDASWSWLNDGSSRAAVAAWSLTLRAAADRRAPVAETTCVNVTRSNAHGLTPTNRLYRPNNRPGISPTGAAARITDDGVALQAISSPSAYRHRADPATHYDAAVRIEQLHDDGAWYPIVGRHLTTDEPTDVRITNGLVRATMSGALEVYDQAGAAWIDPTALGMSVYIGATTSMDRQAPVILRNDIDAAVVRCFVRDSNLSDSTIIVDVAINTGDIYTSITLSEIVGTGTLGIRWSLASGATSAVTGGVEQTTAAGDGTKALIYSPVAVAAAAQRVTTSVAAARASFCVAYELSTMSGASPYFTATRKARIIDDYFAPVYAKTRIVAR